MRSTLKAVSLSPPPLAQMWTTYPSVLAAITLLTLDGRGALRTLQWWLKPYIGGFGHEHNRPDRDDYVVIDFGNIQDAAKPYFKKYTPKDPVKDEQLAYDYLSLMHATDMYDDRVNIDTSKPVIWRKDGGQDLGQRSMLTPLDKQRLRKIYSCEVCKTETANNKLFRYPGDCSKYISCSNTFPYVMNCPSGLHFSLDYNRCEYPITANCTNLTSV